MSAVAVAAGLLQGCASAPAGPSPAAQTAAPPSPVASAAAEPARVPPPPPKPAAPPAKAPAAADKPDVVTEKPSTESTLTPGALAFSDTSKFDSHLSDALDKPAGEVVVESNDPISPNALPPRLEKWFSAVVKSGGTVKVRKAPPPSADGTPGTRAFFLTEAFDLVFDMYDYVHDMVLYAPAKKYNVVVTYQGSEIQHINFVKRVPAS